MLIFLYRNASLVRGPQRGGEDSPEDDTGAGGKGDRRTRPQTRRIDRWPTDETKIA